MSQRTYSGFLILFVLLAIGALGQNSTSSPYSRYGLGDLQFGGFAKNLGMDGLAIGLPSFGGINFSNPATYPEITLTTFEAAGNHSIFQLKNNTTTGFQQNSSFSYFALGVPVKSRKIGAAFGLLPYSNVGYSITDSKFNAAGDVELHKYDGSGGLNRFFLGAGFTPFKNWSVGINSSFVFGNIDYDRRIEYPSRNYYNSRVTQSTIINDFYFNLGILKSFDSLIIARSDSVVLIERRIKVLSDSIKQTDNNNLRDELKEAIASRGSIVGKVQKSAWSMAISIVGSPSLDLKGKQSLLARSYLLTSEGEEVLRDTVINKEDRSGKLRLPFSIGGGLSIRNANRFLAGVDFSMQDWSKYSLFGIQDSLSNSWRLTAGCQWTPNDRSLRSYFNLVQYRLGLHYEKTFLSFYNTQLADYGLSVGFGFPIRRAGTTMQIAVQSGKRGTINDNLIESNYLKFTLGFTLNDRWFVKPKFD